MGILLILIMPLIVTGGSVGRDTDQYIDSDDPPERPVLLNGSLYLEETWQVQLGDVCQITRFPLPSSEPSRYLECIKPYDDEKTWPWQDKGIWVLKQCPPSYEFHLLSQSCRTKRFIRRQQSMCNQNPAPSYCPQPQQQQYSVQPQQPQGMACQCPPQVSVCICPQPQGYQPQPQSGGGGHGGGGGCMPAPPSNCVQPPQPCPMAPQGGQNAQPGELCSWMLAPLAADPTSNKCFLQCAPAPGNAYCGRWVRMPCAPATIFDVNVQVCVHDPNNMPGPVPGYTGGGGGCQGGSAIGQCNVNMQCPGQSTCQMPQQQSMPQQCQQQPQQCSVCCHMGGGGGGMGGGAPPPAPSYPAMGGGGGYGK